MILFELWISYFRKYIFIEIQSVFTDIDVGTQHNSNTSQSLLQHPQPTQHNT